MASNDGERAALARAASSRSLKSEKQASDLEKQEVLSGPTPVGAVRVGEELQRQMKPRHVAMISIGGAIGTGLFLGTANALRHGGPLGLLLGYSLVGTIVYAVMSALGELASHLPIPGGQVTLAARFVSPAFAFVTGWYYWYDWALALPAELSASAVLISYWNDSINPAAWITVTGVVAIAINFGGARLYGEAEFWFAGIKVVTIIGLIILGVILTAGGGPSGEVIGGSNWREPFVQYLNIQGSLGRFLGFWAVLVQAAYSYIGAEIVALAAAETSNPKKAIPTAIRSVWVRLLLFYVIGVFIIGLLVPSNDPRLNLGSGTAASSPFVIAMTDSGIKVLPSIINAALLTSAWSAASSDLYTASRALYGLALQGNAPRIFARTNSWGLPWVATVGSASLALLAYMSTSSGAGRAFGYFSNMTSVCGLLLWWAVCITYLRFYYAAKAQGFDRKALPYVAPLQPYLTYYAVVLISVILFFSNFTVFVNGNWSTSDFITSYLPIILFPVVFVIVYCHKRFIRGAPREIWSTMPLAELDLISGSRSDETEDVEEKKPTTWYGKILAFLF